MRKYQTEFGLNVFTQYKKIISVNQLEYFKEDEAHNYHIYGILMGPRYFIKPHSYEQFMDHFTTVIFTTIDDITTEYSLDIQIDSSLDHRDIELSSSYPHNELKITINDDAFCEKYGIPDHAIEITATDLFNGVGAMQVKRVRYKVLYIGQAYGKRGERGAIDRLSAHSTLQKILIDCQRIYPQYDLYILLMDMAHRLGMDISRPDIPTAKISSDDDRHIEDVLSELPEERQVINITEAALINYFKPEYNSTFVENFPLPTHKSYRQYYDLDYNEVTVEVDMEFDNFPFVELYTDTATIDSPWKFVHYQLDNSNERESMYAIFNNSLH